MRQLCVYFYAVAILESDNLKPELYELCVHKVKLWVSYKSCGIRARIACHKKFFNLST